MSIIPKVATDASQKVVEGGNSVIDKYVFGSRDAFYNNVESSDAAQAVTNAYEARKYAIDIPAKYKEASSSEAGSCVREVLRALALAAREQILPLLNAIRQALNSFLVALDAQSVIYEAQLLAMKISNFDNEWRRVALVYGIELAQNAITTYTPTQILDLASACPDIGLFKTFLQDVINMPVRIAKGLLFEINQKLSVQAAIQFAIDRINYMKNFFRSFIADIEYVIAVV